VKKEDLVKRVKDAKDIVEEAFGTDGDPMVKASSIAMLCSKLDITDIDGPEQLMEARKAVRWSPAILKPRPPGCPLITSLNCIRGNKDVLWRGTCTFLDADCHNIEKALSYGDFNTCHTFMAKELLEAREKEAK